MNDANGLFDNPVPVDEEMVKLATQLIDRQTALYDAADIEDRYEIRLRTMIEAKLKGEGEEMGEATEAPRSNVVDLMAALKLSLGQSEQPAKNVAPPSPAAAKPKADRLANSQRASRKRA